MNKYKLNQLFIDKANYLLMHFKLKNHALLNKFWIYRWFRITCKNRFVLKPKLREQLAIERFKHDIGERSGPKILIPLLETSHYQHHHILFLAKALSLRGAQIKIIFCGGRLDGCEIKNVNQTQRDPCLRCRLNLKQLIPEFGLDFYEIKDLIDEKTIKKITNLSESIAKSYPEQYDYRGVNIIPMTNDSVVRYYYGAVPYSDIEQLTNIRKKYLTTAMIGIEVAETLLNIWRPDSILNHMIAYADWNSYYEYFKLKGIPTNTISITALNFNSIVFNLSELYSSNKRYYQWLKSRQSAELEFEEKAALLEFMNLRFIGSSKIFEELNCFDNQGITCKAIKIDTKKRNIFLFPNLFWDVGLSECGGLYKDPISWVLDTIELLKNNSECHLYIKPHPVETFHQGGKSLKGIVDFIFERYSSLPENITIISPELKLKPYELFSYIDVGVVFNGTLGIEMLMKEIPVIACGMATYGRLGLVSEPRTRTEYLDMLLENVQLTSPSQQQVELFNYFYFIKAAIPWRLTPQAYGDHFHGGAFKHLDDLQEGKDRYLDHLCNCILRSENTIVENWV